MNPIIAANWKMNLTIDEGSVLIDEVLDCSSPDDSEIIFFPTSIALGSVSNKLKNTGYGVGVQNIHHKESGAFTGEISAQMLQSLAVEYAIIGHSERRHYFLETDIQINGKTQNALNQGLCPIVCIGETLEQRESGKTFEVLKKQLVSACKDIGPEPEKFIVAYEPVWAIGTGKSASTDQVHDAHKYINATLNALFEKHIPILYGGSVNAENASELYAVENVDGFLIGGASLNAKSFCRIIQNVTKNIKRSL